MSSPVNEVEIGHGRCGSPNIGDYVTTEGGGVVIPDVAVAGVDVDSHAASRGNSVEPRSLEEVVRVKGISVHITTVKV